PWNYSLEFSISQADCRPWIAASDVSKLLLRIATPMKTAYTLRMSTPVAYLNGRWVEAAELAVPIADLGFTMGVTVTERLRTFGGRVFRQAEHLARFSHSLSI